MIHSQRGAACDRVQIALSPSVRPGIAPSHIEVRQEHSAPHAQGPRPPSQSLPECPYGDFSAYSRNVIQDANCSPCRLRSLVSSLASAPVQHELWLNRQPLAKIAKTYPASPCPPPSSRNSSPRSRCSPLQGSQQWSIGFPPPPRQTGPCSRWQRAACPSNPCRCSGSGCHSVITLLEGLAKWGRNSDYCSHKTFLSIRTLLDCHTKAWNPVVMECPKRCACK